jgi:hypothetical protein
MGLGVHGSAALGPRPAVKTATGGIHGLESTMAAATILSSTAPERDDLAVKGEHGLGEPRAPGLDDPLVPGWEEFQAGRARFFARLAAETSLARSHRGTGALHELSAGSRLTVDVPQSSGTSRNG